MNRWKRLRFPASVAVVAGLAATVVLTGFLSAGNPQPVRRQNSASENPDAVAVPVGESVVTRGGTIGSEVTDFNNTRTIQAFFSNFTDDDRVVLTGTSEIDVATITISNGSFNSGSFAQGGLTIRKANNNYLFLFAVDGYGHQAFNFQQPLPLRTGDFVQVTAGTSTSNVEWDVTLHGTKPGVVPTQTSGVVSR